jgi:aspartyl-tRNA synthetase
VTIALGSEGDRGRLLSELSHDDVRSQAARFLSWETIVGMARRLEAAPGDLICIVAGSQAVAEASLGALRLDIGRRLDLADPALIAFAFVVGFPLLEWNGDDHRWDAVHHPFCDVEGEDLPLFETNPSSIRAKSYDLVANGYELASGSIRIHRRELQENVFRLMGYDGQEIEARFGHLLEAFDYGAPPHGGIAPGIDRLVQLLAGESNIREVMAFPKTQSAQDLLFGAPAPVTEQQLAELHLRLRGA